MDDYGSWQCPCAMCMGTLAPPEPTEEEIDAYLASIDAETQTTTQEAT